MNSKIDINKSLQKAKKKYKYKIEVKRMPYGNGTGPDSEGPLSGRRRGFCAGNDRPGCFDPAPGMGLGRGARGGFSQGRGRAGGQGLGRAGGRGGRGAGFGAGRGRRFGEPMAPYPGYGRMVNGIAPGDEPMYAQPPAQASPEIEKKYLEGVLGSMEEELKEVKNRLKELSKTEKKGTTE